MWTKLALPPVVGNWRNPWSGESGIVWHRINPPPAGGYMRNQTLNVVIPSEPLPAPSATVESTVQNLFFTTTKFDDGSKVNRLGMVRLNNAQPVSHVLAFADFDRPLVAYLDEVEVSSLTARKALQLA
jgi:hypothetical protein